MVIRAYIRIPYIQKLVNLIIGNLNGLSVLSGIFDISNDFLLAFPATELDLSFAVNFEMRWSLHGNQLKNDIF